MEKKNIKRDVAHSFQESCQFAFMKKRALEQRFCSETNLPYASIEEKPSQVSHVHYIAIIFGLSLIPYLRNIKNFHCKYGGRTLFLDVLMLEEEHTSSSDIFTVGGCTLFLDILLLEEERTSSSYICIVGGRILESTNHSCQGSQCRRGRIHHPLSKLWVRNIDA